MYNNYRDTNQNPIQTCNSIIDGCSRGTGYISFINRVRGVSDERKQSLDTWDYAFRQLETQVRQFLASSHNPVVLNQLFQKSHFLNYEFNRFLQTQPYHGVVENIQQHFDPNQMYDHSGNKVIHGRETVNGVRLHYVTAGSGEPLLLVHGAPKTSFYWYKLIPLLTDRYTVIAPDVRGFGDSGRPKSGYSMDNIADDLAQLMEKLGYNTYKVHGEDWGAAFSYALAGKYPDRVEKLSFSEMMLPGLGLEDWSVLKPENVYSNHWFWHIIFFAVPDVPEFLISGKEREFWDRLMRDECLDPSAISEELLNEVVRGSAGPGGLRPIFEVYRNDFENMAFVKKNMQRKLTMPVIAIGGEYFMDGEVHRVAGLIAENVTLASLDCGHCLALERPEQLAGLLRNFMG
ncbi:alpha/beta fold hydrolase [Paenibacillus sepulcri]|uniref:Alpha/beta hydrolase n=1 Tax=Paenibacillus sepulcri TaxID=359917 RepID=A0ABS7BWL5_9BACL|nr:alpha/beta hydrolase [Paenibacillus sepulcri]